MGYDVTIEASGDATPEGLTLYGGFSKVDQHQNSTAISDDISEWTAGVKYAVGSFTLGYQYSEEDNGRASTTTGYDNTGYGIVFAINDDLSISYNNYESDQLATTTSTSLSIAACIIMLPGSAWTSTPSIVRLTLSDILLSNYVVSSIRSGIFGNDF